MNFNVIFNEILLHSCTHELLIWLITFGISKDIKKSQSYHFLSNKLTIHIDPSFVTDIYKLSDLFSNPYGLKYA